jgi:hypothetical protein
MVHKGEHEADSIRRLNLIKYSIYFFHLVLIGLWFAAPTLQAAQLSAQSVAPTLTRVEPNNDMVTGGATVQIIGENFQDGATVTIGGNAASKNAASNVIFASPTELEVEAPAGTAGSVDVVVTNPDGKSDTLADGFTYEFSAYDVTEDGLVNILDLVRVASQFGETGAGLEGDIDGNGTVNILDLVVVANHFSQE